MVWVSKPPQKLPPITNILRIFDVTSWVLILASIMSVSVVLLAVSKVGTLYGGKDQDYVDILLVSFRLGHIYFSVTKMLKVQAAECGAISKLVQVPEKRNT